LPVHPFIQRVIRRAYAQGHGDLHLKTVTQVRAYMAQHRPPLLAFSNYENIIVAPNVFIRLHRAQSSHQSPLIIYLRASAYCAGDANDTDYFCYYLSKYLRCHVAALELRLAPEYKFPIPFYDCIACIEYLYNHQELLKIDGKRVALWGESSGANIAAAVANHLKNEKNTWVKQQVLFYPSLDYHQYYLYPSRQAYGHGYLMDKCFTDWSIAQYGASAAIEDERFSPLLTQKFAGLPATLIIAAQYDPLRDEAYYYLEKLRNAGVFSHGISMPGMIHGFLRHAFKIAQARSAQEYAANYLVERWHNGL